MLVELLCCVVLLAAAEGPSAPHAKPETPSGKCPSSDSASSACRHAENAGDDDREETKLTTAKRCNCAKKTPVTATSDCKGCKKSKVTADDQCTGCEKSKVGLAKEGKCCSKSKAAAEKRCDHDVAALACADECCDGCDSKTTVVDADSDAWTRFVATCVAGGPAYQEACSGCKDGYATCKQSATIGVEKCTACPLLERAIVLASAVDAINPEVMPTQDLLREKLAQRDQLQQEIDDLCVATQSWQQVLVRVKVMEVNLTKMRKLGIDLGPTSAFFGQGDIAQFAKSTAKPDDCPAKSGCRLGSPYTESTHSCSTDCNEKGLASFLNLLEEHNLAKVLANPSIVAMSGRPASFHVGGQIPIPSGSNSTSACDFVRYGNQVDLLAIALGDNKVRLEIRPRISEVRADRGLVVDGCEIPALNVTEIDTALEMTFGETAALTGLLSRRVTAVRDESGVREEVDHVLLLVVVTPEAVEPRVARATSDRP